MVYVVTDGSGYVKIGVAKDIYSRITALQTGNPNKLLLLMKLETDSLKNDRLLEKILHNEFRDKRLEFDDGTSTEWFDADVFETIKRDARNFLKSICKKYDLAFKIHFHFESQAHEIEPWRKAKLKHTVTSIDLYCQQHDEVPRQPQFSVVKTNCESAKFSVRDMVETKADLESGKMYGCFFFSEEMTTLRSRVQSVHRNEYGFYYKLDNGISYSEEMLQAI